MSLNVWIESFPKAGRNEVTFHCYKGDGSLKLSQKNFNDFPSKQFSRKTLNPNRLNLPLKQKGKSNPNKQAIQSISYNIKFEIRQQSRYGERRDSHHIIKGK